MKQLDANTLVAYVDGELDVESAALVESLLVDDAEAYEVAATLRETASLIRAAHGHVVHEAIPDRFLEIFDSVPVADEIGGEIVPPHLVNMILDTPDDVGNATSSPVKKVAPGAPVISLARRRSVAALATAAVFVAVTVGGGMMLQKYTSALNQGGLTHQARAVTAMDDPWREAAFQEAMETRKSESALIWANPANGRSGAVVPVKTYRRGDGTYCREFRTVDTGASPDQSNYGIACREPGEKGRWVKTVEAISAPGAGSKLKF